MLRVTPLGAGKHVGRSCILLEIAGFRVLLDCGVAVAVPEERRYPEFKDLDVAKLDLVLLTHFHLDHAGALPYLTEVLGYRGLLLMTHPTRAIAPLILRDFLRFRPQKKEDARYKTEMINPCFERAKCVQLQERVVVKENLTVTAYYAGHVLGAVMFLVEAGGLSALYTGDFTTVPDHHLSAARVPLGLRPDVMITETTCCTTVRSSKRMKEYELCCKVQECLEKGGKVLVPLLMMGRSQEICMIFEEHWARAQLAYPIIVIRGYSEQAGALFQLFASWGSRKVRSSEKPFEFPHVRVADVEEVLAMPTPAVVLAGPAMLDAGSSLQIFKSLAPDSKNLVVIPGYCLPGTVGNLVQAKSKQIELDEEIIRVKCEVETVSHSDHTDSRGILELIAQTSPQQVVLVHGAEPLMKSFQPIVTRRLKLPCYSPGVGETVELVAADSLQVLASPALLLEAQVVEAPPVLSSLPVMHGSAPPAATFSALARKRGRDLYELHPRSEEGLAQCGLKAHRVRFSHRCTLSANDLQEALSIVGHENPLEGEGPWDLNIGGLSCKVGKEAAAFVVTVLWDRKAEAEVPKLSTFLEALGAGGLGARG
ncbi:unnamed protein product [Durusdinium trenchii]|uniref:Integrator complex subunit 11 n=1 Tax=Durusdinium trenchii TaxID=1381693 RepID=A0ABP0HLM6_9DINO